MIREIGFDIDVKRPPHYDGWQCFIAFDGKDMSTEMNQSLCLFFEDFKNIREEYKVYQRSFESYQEWQDKTLAYYSSVDLSDKEIEELSDTERIKRFNAIMNERYGKKES